MKLAHAQPMDDVSAFILAGGKSSRMGSDKAYVQFRGQTLLQRALEVTKTVTEHVWIVGDFRRFFSEGRVVEDIFRNCGPLGGIHAALTASGTELNVFLAVDLPLVPGELLYFLLREARKNQAIVTLPQAGGRLQPLCAVYRRHFVEVAKQALLRGENKIDALFKDVEILVLSPAELDAAGFQEDVFHNLNTPEDVAAIKSERS
jgi:molybdopterin-guanine dinucleotide biosynthesis protein A